VSHSGPESLRLLVTAVGRQCAQQDHRLSSFLVTGGTPGTVVTHPDQFSLRRKCCERKVKDAVGVSQKSSCEGSQHRSKGCRVVRVHGEGSSVAGA
jgi:hypothetical protein